MSRRISDDGGMCVPGGRLTLEVPRTEERADTRQPETALRWALIVDWDGVIVDSSRQHERSWEQLAVEEGYRLPEEHFKRGFGMKNHTIISELLGWTRDPRRLERMSRRKETLYRQIVRDEGLSLIAGARELLQRLQAAGIPCAVGSSTPRDNLTFAIAHLGLQGCFAALVAAEDVTRGKPDPEVFLSAAGRLRADPSRCVVFEDTPVGLQAARAAGMKAVGVVTTYPAGALDGADRLVHRVDELTVEALRALALDPAAGRHA